MRNQKSKGFRRMSCLVSAPTLYNLQKLAKMAGYGHNLGKVIDKLTRDQMLRMRGDVE